MQIPTIGFIGAGNMASALVLGLARGGHPLEQIQVHDPVASQIRQLEEALKPMGLPGHLRGSTQATSLAHCDMLVLAVKPQVMPSVARGLAKVVRSDALILSVAAGINLATLRNWTGHRHLIRSMPNTPALIGTGATALFAPSETLASHRDLAERLFSAVGLTEWVDNENLLDTVTAISGSGPAYFFLLMEAMIEAGTRMGLERDKVSRLCLQTALGAAKLAAENPDVAELRRRVTSPGGTTEQAIATLERGEFRGLVYQAMLDCAQRSQEMSEEAESL